MNNQESRPIYNVTSQEEAIILRKMRASRNAYQNDNKLTRKILIINPETGRRTTVIQCCRVDE
jgi:hypothetical protein